jgi:hypothetical protein
VNSKQAMNNVKHTSISFHHNTTMEVSAPPGLVLALALSITTLCAQSPNDEDATAAAAELAKKLQNPVANLIGVPIQNNWDFGIGPEHAMRYTANIQPVIPFSIGEDWNLITRTIVPVIYAELPVASGSDKAGLGRRPNSARDYPRVDRGQSPRLVPPRTRAGGTGCRYSSQRELGVRPADRVVDVENQSYRGIDVWVSQ